MRILVGDDTGLIRSVEVEDSKVLTTYGEQGTGNTILCMTRVEEDHFCTAHEDRCLRIYSIKDSTYSYQAQLPSDSEVVSLLYNNNTLYSVQKNGEIYSTAVLYEDDMPYLDEPQFIYKVNATQTNKGRLNPFDLNTMLVLCKDTNPQLIDLTEKEAIWKARNVKNDHLDLQIPIFDIDADFKTKNEFYVVTAYRKIRFYDTKVKNCKPVIDYLDQNDKYPFNGILLNQDKSLAYVSDTAGSALVLDTRKNFKVVGKLKGATGAVKSMALSQNHPYIATVGLDRFLRVYNTNTNKLFRKIYLKHKLKTVAIIDDQIDSEKEQEEPEVNKAISSFTPQNAIKKKSLDMKAKMKESKLRLTFEKRKKIHREEDDQIQEMNENEYEEEDWEANQENEEW